MQSQTKDQRVFSLASAIVSLMRAHPRRHEAFDALDVAKVLFRPPLPDLDSLNFPGMGNLADSASASRSLSAVQESAEAIR